MVRLVFCLLVLLLSAVAHAHGPAVMRARQAVEAALGTESSSESARSLAEKAEGRVGGAWQVVQVRVFLYHGWNVVAEFDAASPATGSPRQLVQSYLWGTDLSGTPQGAGGVGGLLVLTDHRNGGTGSHGYAYDGNGNVLALVALNTGTISARYDYDPFGQPLGSSGPASRLNPYRFSTKYTDPFTDLAYRASTDPCYLAQLWTLLSPSLQQQFGTADGISKFFANLGVGAMFAAAAPSATNKAKSGLFRIFDELAELARARKLPCAANSALGAARAARFGGNWQSVSLKETISTVAGDAPVITKTASGKVIYTHPKTGIQVVHNVSGNYFRVENPAATGSGRYLDQFGKPIPDNVPLVKPNGSTETGVPKDVRNALTHFNNAD